MGRNKNPENKTVAENLQERLDAARQMRLAMAKPKSPKNDEDNREKFADFWARQKRVYGKEKDLEEVLWLHLKAINHDEPSLFEKGIENFGLKKVGE
jgi:hypothetical protein